MDTKTTTKKKLSLLPLFWKGLGGSLLLLALTGCPGESPIDNPDDPSNPEAKVEYVMQNTNLQGTVKDATGSPLGGVKVTTGTLSATTGSDGKFTFDKAGTLNDRAVIKFEKSGYFTQTRSGDKANEMYIEAMLYRKGNDSISLQTDFDAAKEKTLQLRGITVNLPAGCMAKADGSAYSGTVRADVLYLTPVNETASRLMPGGDLMCITADKSEKMLIPFGMVDVTFTDNSGNPLEIKKNSEVKISFPVPAGATAANLPATLPLWTFDEAKGVWMEDGTLTHQGNVYTGTTTHFTPKGLGLSGDWTSIDIKVTACNKPAVGARVATSYEYLELAPLFSSTLDELYGIFPPSGLTLSDGTFSTIMPEGYLINMKIAVSYKGETQIHEGETTLTGGSTYEFEFNGECEGYDLTFDLIHLSDISFAIKCTPAMPPDPLNKAHHYSPHSFLQGGVAFAGGAFTKTKISGDYPIFPGIDESQGGGWNANFTEYTYFVGTKIGQYTWKGTVSMNPVETYLIDGKSSIQLYKIKSIKIGANTVSVNVVGH